jgi:uncharacterized protein (DUF302 family)
LPLKVLIWEDARGRVWVGYQNMKQFDAQNHLKDEQTSQAISGMLEDIIGKAASVY